MIPSVQCKMSPLVPFEAFKSKTKLLSFVLSGWGNLQDMLNCLHIVSEVGAIIFDKHSY